MQNDLSKTFVDQLNAADREADESQIAYLASPKLFESLVKLRAAEIEKRVTETAEQIINAHKANESGPRPE